MKTGSEIEEDFYQAIRNTEFARAVVKGEVYRSDFRPRDSKKEDIIVRFTAVTSGQIQEGVITVLAYVPDISVRGVGAKVRNSARLSELETAAAAMMESLPCSPELRDYNGITCETGIRSYPDGNEQHFVSVRINFKYLNNKY